MIATKKELKRLEQRLERIEKMMGMLLEATGHVVKHCETARAKFNSLVLKVLAQEATVKNGGSNDGIMH